MIRLGMSNPVKGLEFIQEVLNQAQSSPKPAPNRPKSKDLQAIMNRSRRPQGGFGGQPIASISGNPPAKPLGKIKGNCTICGEKAARRFDRTLYCNRHYRKHLEYRKTEFWMQQTRTSPVINLQTFEEWVKMKESK